MNDRQRTRAVLHYQAYDRLPLCAFGYWKETAVKWAEQGHIRMDWAQDYAVHGDNGPGDRAIMDALGFDFNWGASLGINSYLFPGFQEELLEERADGSRILRDAEGLIVLVKPGVVSIPSEIGTTLTGREAWENLYLPKLRFSQARVDQGRDALLGAKAADAQRQRPLGLHVGSLYGNIRNMLGVEALSYLAVDDEELYQEIIDTLGQLCLETTQAALDLYDGFEYAHFWEDICFNHGPLVNPRVFAELVGPWYRRITDVVHQHGIDIVSLDCDGCIDRLVPIWLENGVNTMFPIEVAPGTPPSSPGAPNTAGSFEASAAWTSASSPGTRPPWMPNWNACAPWWTWADTCPAPTIASRRMQNSGSSPITASGFARSSVNFRPKAGKKGAFPAWEALPFF